MTLAGALLALALAPSTARAQYVDPGSASIIVQVVIAAIVGIAAAVKIYWNRITSFLGRRSRTDAER